MNLKVSNIDLIVLNGGSTVPGTGHRSHYPVWLSDDGSEYVYLDGQTPTLLSSIKNLSVVNRETVVR